MELFNNIPALLVIAAAVGVGLLFFWLAIYLFRNPTFSIVTIVAGVFVALLGCACLFAAFVFGSCAFGNFRIGG